MISLSLRRHARTLLAAGAATIALLALPATAAAALNCTFVAGALTVTRSGAGVDEIVFRVNGTAIQAIANGAPIACPGGPTTLNTASITYDHTGGIADVFIEEPQRFAPGTGGPAEGAGAPEIEMAMNETSGILSDLVLRDTDGSGQSYVLGSLGTNFNPGEPAPDPDLVVTGFVLEVTPEGGPGPDSFDLRGGPGLGGPYDEFLDLEGEGGNDKLYSGTSTFRMDGGPGDDLLDGSVYDRAMADYNDSTAPVNIDLAATGPQDAGSLGRDTLVSIERVEGSKFGDVLRGSAAEDELDGQGGDDLIEGRGGDDDLDGGGGIDTASYESAPSAVVVDLDSDSSPVGGGAGEDSFFGGDLENVIGSPFNDTLTGTSGINRIDPRGGQDTVKALGGDDLVLARDKAGDVVDCGTGSDEGVFDQPGLDSVVGCEVASFADIAVNVVLGGPKRQKLGKRGVAVVVRCPEEACTARLSATAKIKGQRKALKLKGVRAGLTAGKAKTLRLAIGKRARARIAKALRAGKKVTIRVAVTATDAAGNRETESRTIVLKGAKPKAKPRKR